MNIEKIIGLLFDLVERQEGVVIDYEIKRKEEKEERSA